MDRSLIAGVPRLSAECVLRQRAQLGEGPVWDSANRRLHWVDIMANDIHMFDPASGSTQTIHLGEMVGSIAPRAGGGLVAAVESGFAFVDLETGRLKHVATIHSKGSDLRFNDGKCDPAGRFWAGTIRKDGQMRPDAALYCLDRDHSVRQMLDKVGNSNGLAWSTDRSTMFYVDTFTSRVDAFDYNVVSGEIANRRPVIEIPRSFGWPDGMTIDAQDKLWIAIWGGRGVGRYDPADGRLLQWIDVPADHTTSCTFAGDNLNELYITSALYPLSKEQRDQQPLAGGLFRVQVGTTGTSSFAYAG